MPTHTLRLDAVTGQRRKLRDEDAVAMQAKGFRFSVFRPGREECRLSIPYQVLEDRERGTLTYMQDEDMR